MEHEERIRLRAHTIWVNEGCLPGREQANWEQAKRELDVPNPGEHLETGDHAMMVSGGNANDTSRLMGVDDQNIGHLDDAADRRPLFGSKLVGS